jgi:hypothetical protein
LESCGHCKRGIVVVEYDNTSRYVGRFQEFREDADELADQGKARFITWENDTEFIRAYLRSGTLDRSYSIVLEIARIKSVTTLNTFYVLPQKVEL